MYSVVGLVQEAFIIKVKGMFSIYFNTLTFNMMKAMGIKHLALIREAN